VKPEGSRPPHGTVRRPTQWWLSMLQRRAERMYEEKLDLSKPIEWSSEAERRSAVAFFNAAFRAEESGLTQAHQLADDVRTWDPDLAECLRLYGDEEGWHRELLTEFLEYIGGDVRPMGRVTGTFYRLYAMAKQMETIVLVNLMFETIGSTTYRLALRRARHPAVRQMLTILTRDESFHVPLNVHFLRETLEHHRTTHGTSVTSRVKLRVLYNLLFASLIGSSYASRRKAKEFDQITFKELSTAYAEHLGALFLREKDLSFKPPVALLKLFGLDLAHLEAMEDSGAVSVAAAEAAANREEVVVTAL
jgi:hypothetical protein